MSNEANDKFSFRILEKISFKKDGSVKEVKIKERNSRSRKFLGKERKLVTQIGQADALCNSAIRTHFSNRNNGDSTSAGVLFYADVEGISENTKSSKNGALKFVKKYVNHLNSTGIFTKMHCIGFIKPPIKESSLVIRKSDLKGIVRIDRIAAIAGGIIAMNMVKNEPNLENFIGVVVPWDDKKFPIKSQHHALMHAMAIRYMFYARYSNIADSFIEIIEEDNDIDNFSAFCLAHYAHYHDLTRHKAKDSTPYQPYYGCMPELKLMSMPRLSDVIVSLAKGEEDVNNSMTNSSEGMIKTIKGTFGLTKKVDTTQNDKPYAKLLKLMDNKKYTDALSLINNNISSK